MNTTRYSPKRDAILQCLRSTTCHPSAEWVYSQLKPKIPDLSLATVYRNLARFRAEGAVQVIDINTLGVLYVLENGDTIQSVEDLRGKTI